MTSVVTTGFISPSISGMQQDSREKQETTTKKVQIIAPLIYS